MNFSECNTSSPSKKVAEDCPKSFDCLPHTAGDFGMDVIFAMAPYSDIPFQKKSGKNPPNGRGL